MKLKASFTAPLFVTILYILFFASKHLKNSLSSAGGNDYLSVIIVQMLIFVLPTIIFCRLKGVGYTSKLNIKLFSPGKFGAIISSALALIFGSIIIRFVQIYGFSMSDFTISPFESFIRNGTPYSFLFKATAFAVIPALTDEFVFRAVLLTEYNEGGYSTFSAIAVTSVLSSFLFFTAEAFPVRLLCSVVFALLTYATGSSITALISHLIFNIYAVFGERYIIRALSDPSNKVISIFTFSLLFLILMFIMFGEFEHALRQSGKQGLPSPSYLLKKTDDGKTPDVALTEKEEEGKNSKVMSEKSKKLIEALFSPTFLICILIFVISIFGFIG